MGKKIKKAFKKVASVDPFGIIDTVLGGGEADNALKAQMEFERVQTQQQEQLNNSIRQQQMAQQQLAAANAAQDIQTNIQFGGDEAPDDILGRRRRAGTGNASTQLGII